MTIRYKSETYDLTTTNITTVLTCPADATILVKSLQASHQTASNVDVDAYLQKSGGSNVEISHAQLNKNFTNMFHCRKWGSNCTKTGGHCTKIAQKLDNFRLLGK